MPSPTTPSESNFSPTGLRRAALEAILWMADQPLSLRRLAKLANLQDSAEAKKLLNAIRQRHADRRSAFEIVELAGGLQLRTRSSFAPWIDKLSPDPKGLGISTPGLETLAIVAYRQPILRAEIEAIRGVNCTDLLRQLLQSDLLRIVGRSEELGRPLLYGTTGRFLQVFGLRDLEDLPQPDETTATARPTNNNAPLSTNHAPSHDRAA